MNYKILKLFNGHGEHRIKIASSIIDFRLFCGETPFHFPQKGGKIS